MRNRITKILFACCLTVTFLAATTVLTLDAHASGVNYRGPFTGRVVDQETGQPIEGAVVFVRWDLQRITSPVFFDAKEVLTDQDGKFHIPANWSFLPWRNFFLYSAMTIFKAGYGHVQLPGGPPDSEKRLAARLERLTPEERKTMGPGWYFNIRSEEETTVFLLKKLYTKEEYGNNIPLFGSAVPLEKRQHLMKEMNREEELFRMEKELGK